MISLSPDSKSRGKKMLKIFAFGNSNPILIPALPNITVQMIIQKVIENYTKNSDFDASLLKHPNYPNGKFSRKTIIFFIDL